MTTVFEKPVPDVRSTRSGFGGGWLVPLTPYGSQVLLDYYQEEPAPIAPLGGTLGYIVEPQDAEDVTNYLKSEGVKWECEL